MSTPCWKCEGQQLTEQEGAARAALCEKHLQERVRELMGLQDAA